MKNKPASRQPHNQFQHRLKPVYAAVLLALSVQAAQANPVGGNVVNGSASFTTSGSTLTVTNTPGTIINWQGFSIGSSEATYFAQQSSSSTVLNRVVGNDPSNVLGRLGSNGRVFLVNPNGILFGAGAIVDVAGLVASTLNLSDADFLAGNYHFTAVPGAANVSNAGNITSQDNGQIFLIAPNVENTGVITAPNGEILLAAGASVDLVNTNDPNLRVSITAPAGDATNIGQLIASSGSLGLFGTVVRNSGIANADSATLQGGKIVFKASQLEEISGTVSATGVQGGDIQILGKQVALINSANVDASGTNGGGTVLVGGDAHGANAAVQNAQQTFVSSDATIKADALQNGNGGKVVVWADGATQFNGNISARGGTVSGNGGWVEVSGKQWLGYAGLVNTTAANGMVGSLLLDPTDITIGVGLDSASLAYTAGVFSDPTTTPSNLNVTTLQNQLASSNVTVDTTSTLLGTGNITIADSLIYSSPNTLTLNAVGAGSILVNTNTSSLLAVIPLQIDISGGGSLVMQTAGGSIGIGAAAGVNIAGGGSFTANAGGATSDVIFNSAINTGAGAINLTAGQSITELAGGSLTTTGLLTTKSAAGTTLNGANAVDNFAATNTGSGTIELTNTVANLTLSGISQSGAGAVTVTNTGGITSLGVINSDGDVTLNSTDLIAINNSIISTLPINLVLNHGAAGNVTLAGTLDLAVGSLDIQNAGVSGTGTLNVTGGTITLKGALTAGTYAQSGGTWNQVIPTLPAFTVNDFSIAGGTFIRALGGDGSIINPYQMFDIYGVQGIGSAGMLGNSYVLANNIDAAGTLNWNAGAGFAPVGSGSGFTGQFNGQVHTISGLYINRPAENNVGLFGYVSGGSIRNVGLVNASVTGASSVGGLVGYDYIGSISNSYVSGSTVTGTYYVGGLVGYNDGTISNSYTDNSNSFNGGNVSGISYVGGLVGYNSGTISGSHVDNTNAYGGIVSGASSYAGGLAGYNWGTIDTCYVSGGSVNGAWKVGGLVGDNHGYSSAIINRTNGIISNSYVSGGTVSATGNYLGGLVGFNSFGIVSNNHVDTGTTVSGVDYVGGLIGWDGGEGVFTGNTITDTTVNGNSYVGGLAGGISHVSIYSVAGYADNNHVVNSNINGGTVSGSYVGGLVGLNGGNITNSYVSGGTVKGSSSVGGLVGQNGAGTTSFNAGAGTISNSYVNTYLNTGTVVSGSNNVGGLVGLNMTGTTYYGQPFSSTITGSYVSGGSVTGGWNVGGLVGQNMGSIVGSYVNTGTIVNGSSSVGGLVGYNSGSISGSYVSGGTVTGGSNVGGLVGNNAGVVSASYVSGGNVSGSSNVGGLVGQNGGTTISAGIGTISNSYVNTYLNTGTVVSGSNNVGGLVGINNGGTSSGVPFSSTITGSYVNGGTVSVSSGGSVGGLVGYNSGTISGSYVSGGSVSAGCTDCGGAAGGLAGYNNGSISNSFASKGTVSGSNYNGGLVGNNNGSITDTYASGGSVTGAPSGSSAWIYVGGLVGYNTGAINTSYASSGTLSGGGSVGGVVGYNEFSGTVGASFWNTTTAGVSVVNGIGYDATALGGTNTGATGLDSAGMMTMSNFTAAGWSISNTYGTGSIWTIYEGVTMPLLSSFLVPPVIPPLVVDGVANVLDQIVYITDQRHKPKPEDLLVTEDISTGVGGNTLPMCN